MSRYIDVTESAKMIRSLLKKNFPAVKFSVKSSRYAGGASIDIKYEDGPAVEAVRAVTDPFAGAHFDGMIDMQSYVSSYILPDGTVAHGKAAELCALHGGKPEEVHFGSDYVHVSRDYSSPFLEKAIEVFNETHGPSKIVFEQTKYGPKIRSNPWDYTMDIWFSRFLGERAA